MMTTDNTPDIDMDYTITDMQLPSVERDLRAARREARNAEHARAVTQWNCEVLQEEVATLREELHAQASRAEIAEGQIATLSAEHEALKADVQVYLRACEVRSANSLGNITRARNLLREKWGID